MYLFDTDTLSYVVKRVPPPAFLARLASIPAEQQFTSVITVGEMVYGAYRSERRDSLLRSLEDKLWSNIRVLPFNRQAAETYGRLCADLERQGKPLAEPDLRIAAIALRYDLTVVTGNVRHFSRVRELRVENWLVREAG